MATTSSIACRRIAIARRGIARTFQVVQPFPLMTVLENVTGGALFAGGVPTIGAAMDNALEQLEFTGLSPLRRPAGIGTDARRTASGSNSRRASRCDPRLLMLDEVNAGLNAGEIDGALDADPRDRRARHHHPDDRASHEGGDLARHERVLVLHHGELIADGRRQDRPRSARDRGLSRPEIRRATAERSRLSLLTSRGLSAGYGDVRVLWDIDLAVEAGEIVAIVGSNGAGKTHALADHLRTGADASGRIRWPARTSALPPDQSRGARHHARPGRAAAVRGLNVRDNLVLGAYLRRDDAAIRRDLDFVFRLFPRLYERRRQDASTLSGGEQQMCAIGRGIMAAPQLLMIDELSLGLAPRLVERSARRC